MYSKIKIIAVSLLIMLMAGCSQKNAVPEVDKEKIRQVVESSQISVTYENVIRSNKVAGTGPCHVVGKEKDYDVIYSGLAVIGMDPDEIKMEEANGTLRITIPAPKVLKSSIDIKDVKLIETDGADAQGENTELSGVERTRISSAFQSDMEKDALSDISVTKTAREKMKYALKEYIDSIDKASGKRIDITFASEGVE